MNVMRHSLLLDAVKTRLSVPSIAVHLHIENTTCFFKSMRRNRNCLATRRGGTTAVNATAWAQRSGGIGRWGGGRVWRQWAHWPARWSSWCSACNGVSIFLFTSTSSGCLHTDDCRPWKIKIHAGSSEADHRLSKERVLETLRLKLCAPQIYPDHEFHRRGKEVHQQQWSLAK